MKEVEITTDYSVNSDDEANENIIYSLLCINDKIVILGDEKSTLTLINIWTNERYYHFVPNINNDDSMQEIRFLLLNYYIFYE